jgi:peptide/nickel transport system substrate-binding protein
MRRIGFAVLGMALVLLIGACGGESTGGDGSAATDNRSEGTSASGTASEGTELRDLRIAASSEPRTLDTLLTSDTAADLFARNVYETLTAFDTSGDVQPLLATEYEQDGKSWLFHLRDDVTFHDGTPMTSEDVVASFERVLNPDLESGFRDAYLGGVTSVKAVDESTVRIDSKTPDPALASKVTLITITSSDWAAPDDTRMTTDMMGTGPYKFVAWDRGSQISLELNDDYWGEPGHFAEVQVIFRPEASVRLAALNAQEVDVALTIPADLAQQAPKVASGPLSEVAIMRITSAPGHLLGDERVREAVNLAIDREAIISGLYAGEAISAQGQGVIEQVLGFNPEISDYPHDVERAKALIEEAGAVGKPITMLAPIGRFTRDREVGQAIADQLNAIGLKTEATFLEPTKWSEAAFIGGEPENKHDLAFLGSSNDLFDSYYSLSLYSCGAPYSGTCDEDVDAAIEGGVSAGTLDERAAGFAEAWKLIHDRFLVMPIAVPNQVHGITEELEWTPRPQNFIFFSDIKATA